MTSPLTDEQRWRLLAAIDDAGAQLSQAEVELAKADGRLRKLDSIISKVRSVASKAGIELSTPSAAAQAADQSEFVSAKTSGLGVRTFRRAAKEGEFEIFKVGREWRARRSDIEAYIQRQQVTIDRPRATTTRSSKPLSVDPLDRMIASGLVTKLPRKEGQ